MKYYVLFPYVLQLTGIQYHEDGSVARGIVENGAWEYKSDEDFVYALHNDYPKPVTTAKRNKEIEVLIEVVGNYSNYNEIIYQAELLYESQRN